MKTKATFIISIKDRYKVHSTMDDMYSFFNETLGKDFSSNEETLVKEHEIAFFGAEETIVIISEVSKNLYSVIIQSANNIIVRGLSGYLEEVIEDETIYEIKEATL